MTLLTFIIPVRHQDNAADWSVLKANLTQTIASISAQRDPDWRAVIVANHGADLPELPERFGVAWVDFPPNQLHAFGSGSRDAVLDAFRFDKGRRVLAGMLSARDSDYFMIVDDDDFVSAGLVEHVRSYRGGYGWAITRGWVWNQGGSLMLQHEAFNRVCGSCLIVRADLYALPDSFEQFSREFVMSMLGSHNGVVKRFAELGTPLEPLPFRGAVYRVGHAGSHSQTPGILRKYVFASPYTRRPWRVLRQISRLRRIGAGLRAEFFGGQNPGK